MQYNSFVELDKEQHCAPNNTVLMGVKADLPDKGTLRICRYYSNVMLGGPSSVLAYRLYQRESRALMAGACSIAASGASHG
jgi:hypothetical protein